MEDKILVNLSTDANHTFECPTNIIGREGEGYISRFEITIPAKFTGCSVYLDFEKPNGEKLRTPKLNMENGVAVYDVHPYLLTDDGEIKAQAVLKAENGQTWKSSKKKYYIQKSINALEEIPQKEDFVTEVQRVIGVHNDEITAIDKRVTTLESAVYGDLAQEFEDNSIAYVKDVPLNALPYAEITKIGGMIHRDEATQTLRSAPVTEVVSAGANLIPYPYVETTKTKNGITFTDNGDGSVTINGTATTDSHFTLANETTIKNNKLAPASYTISGNKTNIIINAVKNGSWWFQDGTGVFNFGDTFTRMAIYIPSGRTINNVTIYPMLNKGSTALPYTAYKEPISFPVPEAVQALDGYGEGANEAYNYIDYEKKQFVKRVRKIVLNGTENWLQASTVSNSLRYQLSVTPSVKRGGANIVCDQYNTVTTGDTWKDINGIAINADRIEIKDTNYTTQADFKARLAENPITVYYELDTPEVIDISDILPEDNYIEVEGGGMLTFKNEYEYDVPSEVVFVTKGASE